MIIRLILSLAFVAGVLWFAARVAKKRGLGAGNGLIEVVARQRMGRSSTVSVLRVADRVLVVGSTEENVTLLAEMDAEAIEEAVAETETRREAERVAHADQRRAALAARAAAHRPAAALHGGDDEDATTQITLPQLPGVPGARRPHRAPVPARHGGGGLVAGSVFDRAAWTQVVEGLRERTVRR